ncbi:hypothetical protein [Aporhodopirellula aestuarii]|nr:hypothetical protein [Aporhodopirellula aestuarii]
MKATLVFAAAFFAAATCQADSNHPNIVLIFADDLVTTSSF